MFHIKKSNKAVEDKAWTQMRVMLDRNMPENKKKRRALFFWLFSAAAVTALIWSAFSPQMGKKETRFITREQPIVASSDGLNKVVNADPATISAGTASPAILREANQVYDAPGHGILQNMEAAQIDNNTSPNESAFSPAKGKEQSPLKENKIVVSEGNINHTKQTPDEADALLSQTGEENSASPGENIISLSTLTISPPELILERELIYCALPMTHVAPPMKTNKVHVYGGLGISMETDPSNRGWMVGSDVTLPLTGKLDIAMGLWHQRKLTTAKSQAFLGAVNAVLPVGSESVVNVSQWTLPFSLRYKSGYGILPYAGIGYHRLSQINWQEFNASSQDVEQTTTTKENKDYFTALVRQQVNKNQFTLDAGFWWKISGRLHLKLNYSHRLDNGEAGMPSGKNSFALSALYAVK